MIQIENDTCRTFPRTLQEAFKVSEHYRDSTEGPVERLPYVSEPERPMTRREKLVDAGAWVVAVVLLVWMVSSWLAGAEILLLGGVR